MIRATHEDSGGTGYCRGCGTTIGEPHHPECDVEAVRVLREACARRDDIISKQTNALTVARAALVNTAGGLAVLHEIDELIGLRVNPPTLANAKAALAKATP